MNALSIFLMISVFFNPPAGDYYQTNSPFLLQELKEDGINCMKPPKQVKIITSDLEINQLKSLYNRHLVAASFSIKNKSKQKITIDINSLKHLLLADDTLLLELTKDQLSPGESCKFYVVYKKLSRLRELLKLYS